MEYKDKFIKFCPLHAAAPALYAALKDAHNCATLMADGTCGGCPASTALALATPKEDRDA